MAAPKHYKRLFIFVCLILTIFNTKTGVSGQEEEASVEEDNGGDDGAGKAGKKDEDQTFEFKTPDMTDEEQYSQHMPIHMLCDGCKLISTMIDKHFEKATRRRGGLLLRESEVIEAVETVCEDKYEDYGAKEVEGVLRLTGPNTEVDKIPGVTSGGGKWPNRIRQLCSRYWDEVGDEEMYTAWREQAGSEFLTFLCTTPEHPRDACFISMLDRFKPEQRAPFIKQAEKDEKTRQQRLAKRAEETAKLRKQQGKSKPKSEL